MCNLMFIMSEQTEKPTRVREQDGVLLSSLDVVERRPVSRMMTITDAVLEPLHAVIPRQQRKQHLLEERMELMW